MAYTPICEVCHARPKMDRSGCCEECWYSGRYSAERRRREARWDPDLEFAYRSGLLYEKTVPRDLDGRPLLDWDGRPTR